jgi:hypothetical protein
MNNLKSNTSKDEISFMISENVSYFNLVSVENISKNIKLVEIMLEKLEHLNAEEVCIKVPLMRELKSDYDCVKEYKKIIPDEENFYVTKGYTNYVVNVFVKKDKFLNYYKGILYRVLTPNLIHFSGNKIMPDSDGWIKVVNRKKIKNENKKRLKKIVNNFKRKYGSWYKKEGNKVSTR